jgi:uncharacterized repeat protein (TIGR03803 family)
MKKPDNWKKLFALILFCTAAAIAAPAQVFTTLQNLNPGTGTYPAEPFVQDWEGSLYTSTANGGKYDWGTVLGITPAGEIIGGVSFNGVDGDGNTPLVLGNDGNLYGTYYNTYTLLPGSIFKLTTDGTYGVLHEFDTTDGYAPLPSESMTVYPNGTLYGATSAGGTYGKGTIFKITMGGDFTSLFSFNGKNGSDPSGLTLGNNGNFYGTTSEGGSEGAGTFFRITPAGELTTLYNFTGINNYPASDGVVLGPDGNFYGSTPFGGTNKDGTIFTITPAGVLTTLYSFTGADGANPYSKLIVADDGNFYGVTYGGGENGEGTIFSLAGNALTTLYSFAEATGGEPYGLMQHTNGTFYGTTSTGGTNGGDSGTFYSFNVGLPPFAALQPSVGEVGITVGILGQGFAGATSVSFNGTAAEFTVNSDTFILATVPEGATTGQVVVTSPSGTLTSNKVFYVIP